mgnify:FL=1
MTAQLPTIDEIIESFELLDDWEERYAYVIELGRMLPPLADDARTEANRVQGCVSQVWLNTRVADGAPDDPVLEFEGDSDALIVKGLVAIMIALNSGRPASEICRTDVEAVLDRIKLREHLTPQRSNGLAALVKRMKGEAERRAAMA